jgi:hypothetical protein
MTAVQPHRTPAVLPLLLLVLLLLNNCYRLLLQAQLTLNIRPHLKPRTTSSLRATWGSCIALQQHSLVLPLLLAVVAAVADRSVLRIRDSVQLYVLP